MENHKMPWSKPKTHLSMPKGINRLRYLRMNLNKTMHEKRESTFYLKKERKRETKPSYMGSSVLTWWLCINSNPHTRAKKQNKNNGIYVKELKTWEKI